MDHEVGVIDYKTESGKNLMLPVKESRELNVTLKELIGVLREKKSDEEKLNVPLDMHW